MHLHNSSLLHLFWDDIVLWKAGFENKKNIDNQFNYLKRISFIIFYIEYLLNKNYYYLVNKLKTKL